MANAETSGETENARNVGQLGTCGNGHAVNKLRGTRCGEGFGSSGRTRTYNPSVNSRVACSRPALQTQLLARVKCGLLRRFARFRGRGNSPKRNGSLAAAESSKPSGELNRGERPEFEWGLLPGPGAERGVCLGGGTEVVRVGNGGAGVRRQGIHSGEGRSCRWGHAVRHPNRWWNRFSTRLGTAPRHATGRATSVLGRVGPRAGHEVSTSIGTGP